MSANKLHFAPDGQTRVCSGDAARNGRYAVSASTMRSEPVQDVCLDCLPHAVKASQIRQHRSTELNDLRQEAITLDVITISWLYEDGREVLSIHGQDGDTATIAVEYPDGRLIWGVQAADETTRETVIRICKIVCP